MRSGAAGQRVLVLERDPAPFMRATYINQARVHMGYHYPRSYSTAIKSAHYFERFCNDYGFCLHTEFDQVYATSAHFSWTNAAEFRRFCAAAGIRCDDVAPERYFNPGLCDGAFLTTEYTYDAQILKRWFLEQLAALPNVEVLYSHKPTAIEKAGSAWRVQAGDITAEAPYLLNATYAGVNDVHAMLGLPPFGIKYEKCEIILCTVDKSLKNTGITVMDGPFFSLMPFGRTGLHSLTSVTFTPHETSYDSVATFPCQQECGGVCKPGSLYNFHPGSHVGQGVEKGIELVAAQLNDVLSSGQTTTVLLETMSGKGSEIGKTFEELAAIIERVELKEKLGVCLDTCHVYSAGYDLVNRLDGVLEHFDSVLGLERLRAIHLNDSMTPFASFKDRHETIGKGSLGEQAFINLINHPVLRELPFFLETPRDDAGHGQEIAWLKEHYRA